MGSHTRGSNNSWALRSEYGNRKGQLLNHFGSTTARNWSGGVGRNGRGSKIFFKTDVFGSIRLPYPILGRSDKYSYVWPQISQVGGRTHEFPPPTSRSLRGPALKDSHGMQIKLDLRPVSDPKWLNRHNTFDWLVRFWPNFQSMGVWVSTFREN